MASIQNLPRPILLKIFSYLDIEEILRSVVKVSGHWAATAKDSSLWRNLEFEGKTFSTRAICGMLRLATSLNSLKLVSVPRTDVIIANICRYNNCIKQLTVKNSKHAIDENLLHKLFEKCNKLEKINFKGTSFPSNTLYRHMIALTNLRSLTVSVNETLTRDNLVEMISNCCKIEELNLLNYEIYKPFLTDEIILKVMAICRFTLRRLKLDCTNLTSQTYKVILDCTRLESINLKNAMFLTNRSLKNIPIKLHLKTLRIENARGLKNEDIMTVFQSKYRRMGNIHSIGFPNLSNLEDSGMNAILQMCGENLKYLCLEGCNKLSTDMVIHIIESCPSLHYFNIAFIPSISNITYAEKIPKKMTHLSTFVVDNTVSYNELLYLNSLMVQLMIMVSENTLFKKHTPFFNYHSQLQYSIFD